MAQWLRQSVLGTQNVHDLEVMGSNPGQVKPGACGTAVCHT